MAPLKTIERFFAFRVPLSDCGVDSNGKTIYILVVCNNDTAQVAELQKGSDG